MFSLDRYREQLSQLHDHVCPRQILGLRMGELAGQLLGLSLPRRDKRLFVFVETDGCFADGVMVATGCSIGHRTMRVVDVGKIAAIFADAHSEPTRALRMWPHPQARDRAWQYAPDAPSRWHAQLAAYQIMPAEELLCVRPVRLKRSLAGLISRPGLRVRCAMCGEEIINQREVVRDGRILCATCAGEAHFEYLSDAPHNLAGEIFRPDPSEQHVNGLILNAR